MKKKGLLLTIGIIVVVAFYLVSSYNGFVTEQEIVNNKWSQIDNQLKRRADLIPNLVNTVKGYAAHEKAVIDSVTSARAQLAGAKTPADKAKADTQLTGALSRLLVVAENYPNLKANENFKALMDELEGTENRISVARKDYNDSVTIYNQKIKKFPGVILARMFGFEKKDYYQVDEKDKVVPNVDFGGNNQ
ncbi:LemA family protein [Bacillus sp. MUM 116]|uniref:LemA family protein n=1 Tax=Bacillus sp. MUM 116 TaxID=1678002 RepID=UPI0008F5A615|nr:LemA family protein [Bacillus sp. MUM 116]OIK12199.1 LemA family protein [Bacillus sp. MUM 116]